MSDRVNEGKIVKKRRATNPILAFFALMLVVLVAIFFGSHHS